VPSIKIIAIIPLLLCRFAVADDDPPSEAKPLEPAKPAQPAGSPAPRSQLSGRVVDIAHGGPVEGAQVRVRDAAGNERLIITDQAGRYTIDVTRSASLAP
jgi:hypothetical protein